MTSNCPECDALRRENLKLLSQLDEAVSQLEPIRLQIQCLESCRRTQIGWAAEARRCLIELANTLQEVADADVPTHDVAKVLATSRGVIR